MATVTGFTAERMLVIENASVVDGNVVGDNLILVRHDGSTIDAGSVRGPTGSPGLTLAEYDAAVAINSPIGSILDYIGVIAPTNWLKMEGQTVVNGQTLYPVLWGLIPVTMKSGSSIVMPDTRGRVSVGYNNTDVAFDAIGEVGGSKTHTLSQAELPAASITINPPTFTVDPPNTTVTITDPGHGHRLLETGGGASFNAAETTGAPGSMIAGVVENSTTGITAAVNIAPIDIDQPPFSSGNLGSGQAHNNLQPYVTFLKIIKAA